MGTPKKQKNNHVKEESSTQNTIKYITNNSPLPLSVCCSWTTFCEVFIIGVVGHFVGSLHNGCRWTTFCGKKPNTFCFLLSTKILHTLHNQVQTASIPNDVT